MKEKEHITGIILAGGKSSRMGADKGLMLFQGKPFIQHIIDALQPLVKEIIVVSGDPKYDTFQQKRVPDLIENSGPLAGLYTGLYHTKTENNIVLSCDVPLITTELLMMLIEENEAQIDVVQLQSGDKTMPLIALYKKRCQSSCLSLLRQGEKRLRMLLKQCRVRTIVLDKTLAEYTANINTQEDLKEIIDEANC